MYKMPEKLLKKRCDLIDIGQNLNYKLIILKKNIEINSEAKKKNVSNIHTWKK